MAASTALEQLAARPLPSPPLRLDDAAAAELLAQLPAAWRVEDGLLRRDFAQPDYAAGVKLVSAIGALADRMNHHPELHLRWGHVGFAVNTHDVDGLSELDFILAANVELLAAAR
jgi:4a-hydroxytetrahydrobiopterin dehydratase